MYRMEIAPPERPLNDYIAEYKESGDKSWIACFFHSFEPKLNGWAYRLCERYGQPRHFQDIKQEMAAALLGKLKTYDPAVGTSLMQFARYDVVNAVHTYIRQNGGVFTVPENRYKTLRRVNAIYYRNRELPFAERIQAVVEQTGLPIKKVEAFVAQGEGFRFYDDLNADENSNGISEYGLAKRIPDIYSSPDYIVPRILLYEAIVTFVEQLRYKDKKLLMDYLGIACLYCGRVCKPISKADIADELQLRDEQSVDNHFKRITKRLREDIEK